MANRIFSLVAGPITTWTLWGVNSLTSRNIFSLDAFDNISVKDQEGKEIQYAQGIMATYASKDDIEVDAKRLSAAVEKAMLPIKTLFAVTVVAYGGSYVLSNYAPIVAPLFSLTNKVLIWVGAELLISIYHMRNLDNFFDQRSVEKKGVTWNNFIEHVNRCTHNILSSTILISSTPEFRKDLHNMGEFLTEIRDNEKIPQKQSEKSSELEGEEKPKRTWQEIAVKRVPGLTAALSLGQQVLSEVAKGGAEGTKKEEEGK